MKTKKQKINKLVWLEIKNGDDLHGALSNYCLKNKIKAGLIFAVGALKNAKFGFYDQTKKKYLAETVNQPLEILSCLGNVSLKDGKPFVHAHLTVSDKTGRVYGGHLEKGTIIFACECAVIEAGGQLLNRKFDKLTGLNLWDFGK
ncbi:MAG: PPC domain-containing DNA-binding protein [Candidatus Falkowbacteria bacterium]